MDKDNNIETRFAVCLNNSDHPVSLELHKIYRALPDTEAAKDKDLRIIDRTLTTGVCFNLPSLIPVIFHN